jgi:hypothetical protein
MGGRFGVHGGRSRVKWPCFTLNFTPVFIRGGALRRRADVRCADSRSSPLHLTPHAARFWVARASRVLVRRRTETIFANNHDFPAKSRTVKVRDREDAITRHVRRMRYPITDHSGFRAEDAVWDEALAMA